ncbi:MAG: succinate dehydrogenase, hydrophobic membrane anchor protein [Methylococcales bacterium]|nr:succinate dehydrogenase, hydrophobic membrane anchor protein [Methylococcales bacterium]
MVYKALKRKAVRLARNTATRHWYYQRLTAIALAPLSIWLVLLLDSSLHEPYEQTLGWLANPVNCLAILAWTVIVFYHAALGVQVVLEDYVSNPSLRKRVISAANLFFLASGLTAGVSIISIVFLGS